MISIRIYSLADAQRLSLGGRILGGHTHALQILGKEEGDFPDLGCPSLRLHFDDVEMNGAGDRATPTTADVAALGAFVGGLPDDATLAVHCFSGRSRSPAAALIAAALRFGRGNEMRAWDLVSGLRSDITPNRLLLEIADRHFAFHGRLVDVGRRARDSAEKRDALLGGGWL